MPRFKQVQKVNTSLCLFASGLAGINFLWHVNASCNDPSRLLPELLSRVCPYSMTNTTFKHDCHVGLGGLGVPAKEGGGWKGAVVRRHYLPAQQNCAGTGRRSPGRKRLSLSSGEHFWGQEQGHKQCVKPADPQLVPISRASEPPLRWNISH